MMYKAVPYDTRICVAAIFYNGKVEPVWFVLGSDKHEVKELCYTWESSEGATPILHYSVWDGKNAYALNYNTQKISWSLIHGCN